MKTIGLIGGISWPSSAEYYKLINEMVNQRLGGVNAAKIILYSVNYEEIKTLTFADNWAAIADMISAIVQKLESAGADCILLCANTMHKIAPNVQQAISIPLIHIATSTGRAIQLSSLKKVALLGTKYTMELGFYQEQLSQFNVSTILPNDEDRQFVHDVIYNELGKNIFLPATKERMLNIINKLQQQGAEGVILGCTEIPLLIQQKDCSLPVFDTTLVHVTAAVDFAL